MDEIEANDFNLNISRYVSMPEEEVEIDLSATHGDLKELGLSSLPAPDK